MFFICYYYYYFFKSFLTSESIYIRPSHGLWKTTIMLVCPEFLRKTRTIFHESSFDPVLSFFVYIYGKGKNILYTVYLQKILFHT